MSKKKPVKKQQAELSLPDKVRAYIDGVMREVKLVTWPNRDQVQATTIVVLVTVFVFALFFGVVDFGLSWAQNALYQTFTQVG